MPVSAPVIRTTGVLISVLLEVYLSPTTSLASKALWIANNALGSCR
jgi:hypothetical protein